MLRVLAPLGLIFDAAAPWVRVTSCAGSPGCARSHADVHSDLEARLRERPVTEREHWCGCERRCGLPACLVTEAVATPTPPLPGRVDGAAMATADCGHPVIRKTATGADLALTTLGWGGAHGRKDASL